jgi:uncharacterized protein
MSRGLESWYSLPDLMALADRGVALEGSIPLARLGRLGEFLRASDGDVTARVELSRSHDDGLKLQLQYRARLELTCQRCLERMVHEVDERVDFAVAETEDSLAVLPKGTELIALAGDRFMPATLLEDELIVSLPLVPRHGDDKP